MKLSDLLKNLDADVLGERDVEVESLSYNAADAAKNSLFFCIEGEKVDGHLFANEAVKNGAVALIVSKDLEVDSKVAMAKVRDTREAMAVISSNFYGNPADALNIIGVTGTNGKTTSTFMLKSILEKAGRGSGLLGTIYDILGDEINEAKRTTPESMDLQRMLKKIRDSGLKYCIMEVSSHSLELKRVFGVNFEVGIFTNLTQDHLDFHKTMENYFFSKLKLFKKCKTSVVNIDDEYGRRIPGLVNNRIVTYGIENRADIYARDINICDKGTTFRLYCGDDSIIVNLHLPGKFNVYNALGCAAASKALGISLQTIKEGLEALKSVPGRSEKISSNEGFTVVIDYAHTHDGLVNILTAAREYTKGRLITVFGCGGDRDRTKRPFMGRAAGELSDFCFLTSDNPRSEDPMGIIMDIIPGIKDTGCNYVIIEDRKEAIKSAIESARKGDVVVIAGKGHETYQVLKDRTIHFDEKEIVMEILGRKKDE